MNRSAASSYAKVQVAHAVIACQEAIAHEKVTCQEYKEEQAKTMVNNNPGRKGFFGLFKKEQLTYEAAITHLDNLIALHQLDGRSLYPHYDLVPNTTTNFCTRLLGACKVSQDHVLYMTVADANWVQSWIQNIDDIDAYEHSPKYWTAN